MTKNHFAIERQDKGVEYLLLHGEDGSIAFEDVMNMSYDELKAFDGIDVFIAAIMDATNEYFNEDDDDVVGRVTDFCEGCPFHYRLFSSVPGLCTLDARHAHFPPPCCYKQKCHCQMSPEEQEWGGIIPG